VEHGGEPLSRYDVEYLPGTDGLAAVARPRLFESCHALPQLRLFELGNAQWLKALKLEGYAPRRHRSPQALQEALFPYLEAL
jgi:hypothetical protein